VANKTDVRKMDELEAEDRALVDGMVSEARKMSSGGASDEGDEEVLLTMSALLEEGLMHVKQVRAGPGPAAGGGAWGGRGRTWARGAAGAGCWGWRRLAGGLVAWPCCGPAARPACSGWGAGHGVPSPLQPG
jgi:hypothetical protein